MNRLRDQGRDYEKIVFMFICGRMFLVVIDNNHVQRVFYFQTFLSHLACLAFELLDAQ